jgi:hypothetical protein
MWKLINADSEYNRIFNFIQWPIYFIAVLANSILGGLEESLAVLALVLGLVIGAATGTESLKTKRIRLLSGLPLPVRKLGIFRHYGLVVGWLTIMTLIFLSSLISRRGHLGPDYVWWVLTKIGSIFIFAGCMNLATDLFYCVKDKKLERALMRWIASPFLVMASMIGGLLYLFTVYGPGIYRGWFLVNLSEMFLSFPGAFGVLLVGLALLMLDVYVYERRRSYTEESSWPH